MRELVYFIGDMNHGPIKIGKSKDVYKRLKVLQTGNPSFLEILGTKSGYPGLESKIHDKFKHLHIRGEWFSRGSDLLEYIGLELDYRENNRGYVRKWGKCLF